MADYKHPCNCILPITLFMLLTYIAQPYFSIQPYFGTQQNGFSGLPLLSASDTDTDSIEKKRLKQNEFLDLIQALQSNCSNNRILVHKLYSQTLDFALFHHWAGMSLLLSLSSRRTMFITGNFRYLNSSVYDEITHCTISEQLLAEPTAKYLHKHGVGDALGHYYSDTNDVTYVGEFSQKHIQDIGWIEYFRSSVFKQQWLQQFPGQFWVRAHVQYYLWMKLNSDSRNIIDDMACVKRIKLLKQSGQKYIGFHIPKYSSSRRIHQMRINPNKTWSLDNFMRFANKIRNSYGKLNLQTIFVSTDDSGVIEQIREIQAMDESAKVDTMYGNWDIICNVDRNIFLEEESGSNEQALWDAIMDIELLRTADFIVGTSTNDMFRLATELHYATNWVTNDYKQTMFSVDNIPWYQSP